MKATQREPAGSTLWSRLEVISTVPGLQEIKYGHCSSQKATLAPSGTCCLSKAIPADAPRCGCRDKMCARGDGSALEQAVRVSSPSCPSSCLSLLCSWPPACLPAGIHRDPMLLALLLFWGEREEGRVERSPAQKRRRESPARLDPWSTGEDGVRLAGRQGWWLSVGWSKGRRVSCIHGSKGRHLEWAWPIGVSQLQRICWNS